MADQHQAGLTKRSGFPLDTMPTLDRLAETGVSFDRAYACAPLCVPSRVSLLTGRWPHAHRVRQNSAANDAVFTKDIFDVVKPFGTIRDAPLVRIPIVLRADVYATAAPA